MQFIEYNLISSILIRAPVSVIWREITNVDLRQVSHPLIFKILGVPKPLRAEIEAEGVGGKRIAFFDNGKSFLQEIVDWAPNKSYGFVFSPEPGFRAGHIFDLSKGPFRILSGYYSLEAVPNGISLILQSSYSVGGRMRFLLAKPIRLVLVAFQRFLLKSIKRNCER